MGSAKVLSIPFGIGQALLQVLLAFIPVGKKSIEELN